MIHIQPKSALVQLEANSFHQVTGYCVEESRAQLALTSSQEVLEREKVFLQPPFLPTKQSPFSHLLLVRPALQGESENVSHAT